MTKRKGRALFITATDTGVGKTTATCVLGLLYQAQGLDVGVMKPVQCGGTDAAVLKRAVHSDDDMAQINPYFAAEPLSPHLAFRRAGRQVDPAKILAAYNMLRARHDILLVEGAGGLLVPLTDTYDTADLIRDMKAEVVIVARLGLGSINHTLLTVRQARSHRLRIRGILFSDAARRRKTIPEQTNPSEIARLSGVPVLGTIPFLPSHNPRTILKLCRHLPIN